jgi:hypothetical protein
MHGETKEMMCSTPFGIIGIRTCATSKKRRHDRGVLNAFRHHWNSHFFRVQ